METNNVAYNLETKIYANRMTEVWVGKKDNVKYAIKIIDGEMDEKVKQEINLMKKIKHENIIYLYDAYIDDFKIYIVMELAKCSLLDLIKNNYKKGLDEKYISIILRQVLNGLKELHSNNIIHRDIKAGNILISHDGIIKISDFGISGILSKHSPTRKTFAGTVCWMAPEVLIQDDTGYDYSVDIWSLGITAIELAFGKAPYQEFHPMKVVVKILKNPAPNPKVLGKDRNKKISYLLRSFVNYCLKKDPVERKSIDQLSNHLFIKKYKKLEPPIILELLDK